MTSFLAATADVATLVALFSLACVGIATGALSNAPDRRRILLGTLVVAAGLPLVMMFVAGGRALSINGVHPSALGSCAWSAGGAGGAQALGNLMLYIPVAALATATFGHPLRVVGYVLAGAVGLETVQTVVDLGVCEVIDVTFNSLGVVVGTLIGALFAISTSGRSIARPTHLHPDPDSYPGDRPRLRGLGG
jgi:hypothetical protein